MRVLFIYISAVLRTVWLFSPASRCSTVLPVCICLSLHRESLERGDRVYSPLCLCLVREKHSGSVCCTELLKLLGRKGSETSAASAHRF